MYKRQELGHCLVELSPGNLTRALFSDNGSNAIEIALKLSFQYWQLVEKPEKRLVVGMEGGYHGDTFGAMSVGKTTGFYKPFEDILHKNSFIPFPKPPINSAILLPPKRNRITKTIIKICKGPIATRLIKDI